MSKRIGFVGVGLMGHGMAKNLVEKGSPLTVLGHRNRQPVEDLVKRGAKEVKDVAELVGGSDIVFLCVTGSPQVEDLVYRKGGILEESGISGPMSAATMQTMLNAMNLGFGEPQHLVASLVQAQAKLNGVAFPPKGNR